ncbi:hypothetical protein QTP86_029561 [Hemibagrus guttatus]|nr:hypothetical protein QTP86_029561 [Hemibagrus guttatus]
MESSADKLQSTHETLGSIMVFQSNTATSGSDSVALGSNTTLQSNSATLGYDNVPLESNDATLGSNSATLGYDNVPLESNDATLGSNSATLGYDNVPLESNDATLGSNSATVESGSVTVNSTVSCEIDEGSSVQVSVIIPVYNAAKWLDECLQALSDQDFQGTLEISLFDDGSTDQSREIAESWRERLRMRGVTMVISGHNTDRPRGVGFAKNKAVAQSSGQYLCFQDADDFMMPQRVRLQYEAAVLNPNTIVGCQVRRIPEGSTERYTRWINTLTSEQLLTQETRWKGSKARSVGAGFKLFYYGVDSKRNGVGVVLKEEFVRNVLEVKRVSDRVMSLKLEIEGVMVNVVSGYAPQVGCELEEKERFWSELDEVMESIPTGERVVIGADFNGHVGEGNRGDEEVMGKFGVKERNLEGQMVVDFAKRMDMGVVNTYFQKREEHRVTYKSGGRRTQVDYILCRRGNLKEISDCKVVVGESVARQHRMVVCRMTLMVCKTKRSKLEKKTKWWKLKKEECCEKFRQKLRQALGGQVVLPDDWETTAEVIRETGRKVLGVSSGRRKEDKETWWWNEEVQDSIQRKRLAKKKWDMDRTEENRQEYKELQRRVKREVSKAKQKAYDELYTRLDTREGEKDLYRLARQRDRDGKDVQQVRVIKDREGRVLTSEESVQRRWKEYFEELMNEENEREKRVEGVNSVEQKVDKIRKDEVRKALKRMKSGKAVGPDDIPVEDRVTFQVYTSHGPTVVMPTWFCSRRWFQKVGPFDEGGKGVPEDLLWFYQSLRRGGGVIRVDECLLIYRYHEHAATHSVLEETIWNLRVDFLQERVLGQWDSFTIWNAGKQGRKLYRSLTSTNQKKNRYSSSYFSQNTDSSARAMPTHLSATQATPTHHSAALAKPTHHSPAQTTPIHHSAAQAMPTHHSSAQATPTHHSSAQAIPTHHSSAQATPTHHSSAQAMPTHHSSAQAMPTHHSSAKAMPTHHSSAQAMPTHHSSAQATPTHHSSAQAIPTHHSSAQATPTHHSSAQAMPTHHSSAQAMPTHHSSAQAMPTHHSSAQAMPTHHSSAQAMPTHHSSAQAMPTHHSSAQATPTHHSSAQAMPTHHSSAQAMPTHHSSAQAMPTHHSSAKAMPTHHSSAQAMPTHHSSAQATPTHHSSAQAMPTHHSSAQAMPTHHSSAQAMPTHHSSAKAMPTHHSSAQAMPTHHSSAKAMPTHHSSAQAMPTHHSSAQATPTHHSSAQATPTHHSSAQAIPTHHSSAQAMPKVTMLHRPRLHVTALHRPFPHITALHRPHPHITVKAFCDVDENKIKKGFYTYEESEERPKPRIPVLHYRDSSPPFIVCVKLVMGIRLLISSSWHLLVGGIYSAASEHFVLKVDVLEAGKMDKRKDLSEFDEGPNSTGALVRSDSDVDVEETPLPVHPSGVESESCFWAGHSRSSTFSNLHLYTMEIFMELLSTQGMVMLEHGLTHEAHARDVEQVYLRCSEGSLEWLYPTGAIIVNLRPNTFPEAGADSRLSACLKPRADSRGASMFVERAGVMRMLLSEEEQAAGRVRCFSLDEGALFVQASTHTDISKRVTAFQYELIRRDRDMAGDTLSPAAPCTPCTDDEILMAVCTSDFVVRGSIVSIRDAGDDEQQTSMLVSVSRLYRQKRRVFEGRGRSRWSGRVMAPPSCGIQLRQGPDSGLEEFLFTGAVRFGEAWLGCAPRYNDFLLMYQAAVESGSNPCHMDMN